MVELSHCAQSRYSHAVFNLTLLLVYILTAGELIADDPPSLADVLMCITGCIEIPPLGFQETPTISFSSSCTPHFSTCALEVVFPLSLPRGYDEFAERFCFFMQNSPDFGSA